MERYASDQRLGAEARILWMRGREAECTTVRARKKEHPCLIVRASQLGLRERVQIMWGGTELNGLGNE